MFLAAALAPQSSEAAKCSTGCLFCEGNLCDLCGVGYGITPQKTCIKCSKNCFECQPNGTCTSCEAGYGITADGRCAKCAVGCMYCDSPLLEAGLCSGCDSEWGLTADKTCARCIEGCDECDAADTPAGQCQECDIGFDITPQKTCTKDCSRYDCCTYDCPLAKPGTCTEEYANFGDLAPIREISWKTTALRQTLKTCKATCLKDPTCFAYRFYGYQKCIGGRPCTRCKCKVFGQHEGTCSLYGADAKNRIHPQSSGTGYIFITRIGGYCWH